MQKRILAAILVVIMIFSFYACKNEKNGTEVAAESDDVQRHKSGNLIGFILPNWNNSRINVAKHSFLSTAEDVGLNAKLYIYDDTVNFNKNVDMVISEKCDGVLIYAPDVDDKTVISAIDSIESEGIRSVSLDKEFTNSSCNVITNNILNDTVSYIYEHTNKSILIFSKDNEDINSINANRSDDSHIKVYNYVFIENENSEKNLISYLSNHDDIGAIYATHYSLTKIAVNAVKKTNPKIIIIGSEITATNKRMLANGLFAITVYPWHEMAAESVYVIEKLLSGEKCSDIHSTVNIVNKDNIDKYSQIQQTANDWFKVG